MADRLGKVLGEDHALVDVDAHGAEVLDRAASMVRTLVAGSELDLADVQAVGMCVPAPLDRRSSRIRTGIMPGWQGLLPAEELERRLGVPVHADNDANLGALAELHQGSARGRHDVVYLKVASGVGAGIVLGGRLHRGASGIAGEIGHVQVGEDGHVCRCGNRGCVETMVSAARLLELLRPAYGAGLGLEQVLALDAEGDAGVRRVLSDAGRTVGRALADLANSLNPELVVVGGTLGGSASLLEGLRASIDRYAQPDTAAALDVVPGALGDRSEVVGAVALAIALTAAT
jgi:predicted NBD/HSP70 family sugar kinase